MEFEEVGLAGVADGEAGDDDEFVAGLEDAAGEEDSVGHREELFGGIDAGSEDGGDATGEGELAAGSFVGREGNDWNDGMDLGHETGSAARAGEADDGAHLRV